MVHEPSHWQEEQAAKHGLPLERFRYPEAPGSINWQHPVRALRVSGHHLGYLDGDKVLVSIYITSTAKGATVPWRVYIDFRGRRLSSYDNSGGLARAAQVARELLREVRLGIS
jgi:hypothetical protein